MDRFCAWEEKGLHYKGQKMHVGTARRRGRWDSRYTEQIHLDIDTACAPQGGDLSGSDLNRSRAAYAGVQS